MRGAAMEIAVGAHTFPLVISEHSNEWLGRARIATFPIPFLLSSIVLRSLYTRSLALAVYCLITSSPFRLARLGVVVASQYITWAGAWRTLFSSWMFISRILFAPS